MLAPRLSQPIVLVHGLMGYHRVALCGVELSCYFPGIGEYLRAGGNRVAVACLSPTHGVRRRALELRRFLLREFPNEPVHVVAHSMGGLDARYMISRLGMEERVLSLTTLGTPHRGSSFADWGIRRFGRLITPFFRCACVPTQAFHDLTTDACRRFNEEVPDVPGVRYASVAGRCDRSWLCFEWLLPYWIVSRAEGPNDGIVSVASATWGGHNEVWEGDHLNLVNWPNRRAKASGLWRDRTTEYGRLLGRLGEER